MDSEQFRRLAEVAPCDIQGRFDVASLQIAKRFVQEKALLVCRCLRAASTDVLRSLSCPASDCVDIGSSQSNSPSNCSLLIVSLGCLVLSLMTMLRNSRTFPGKPYCIHNSRDLSSSLNGCTLLWRA